MSAQIIDGRAIARGIRNTLKAELNGITLTLGLLCTDISQASISYQETIIKIATSLGIKVKLARLKVDAAQEIFETKILEWNEDPNVNGIFVLQPLFDNVRVEELRVLIDPLKDIECVHPYNASFRYFSTDHVGSCTAVAIMEVLKSVGVELKGAEVVVVGHSSIVGQPVSSMLIKEDATVTTCNKATADRGLLRKHVEGADVLIVAVGKSSCIPGEWIKKGAVVIDVGVNDIGEGKFVGDVDFDVACERASYVTPVIGGVGPVTAIVGMRQLFIAYTLQQQKQRSL